MFTLLALTLLNRSRTHLNFDASVFLSTVIARVNADARCEWALTLPFCHCNVSFGVFSGCLTSREETWRTVTRPTQADSLPVWRWKSVLVFGRARSRLAVQTCSQLSGKLFSFQGQISHFLYTFIKTFIIFMLFTRTVAPAIIFHIVTKKIN